MALWRLTQGTSPLVVNVPHAGTLVPDAVSQRLTRAACALPDTDWHVEKLFSFARGKHLTSGGGGASSSGLSQATE